ISKFQISQFPDACFLKISLPLVSGPGTAYPSTPGGPMNKPTLWNRRSLLKNALTLAGIGAGAALLPGTGRTASMALAQAGRGARGAAAAQPTGSTLILLGTQGGPTVNLLRGEAA